MVQGTGTTTAASSGYDAYLEKMATAHQASNNNSGVNANATNTPAKKEDEAVISSKGAKAANEAAWSEDVAKTVKNEFQKLQANIVQMMLKSSGFDGAKVDWNTIFDNLPQGENAMSIDELIEAMPEEWRPDAVADRIVEFSTAFYGKSGLSGEEFYTKIKESIDAGFGGAKDEMGGKLPGNIKGVMEATRQAVYEKLDKWAESMGIKIPYTGEDKVK
jgi:hypothetical protein